MKQNLQIRSGLLPLVWGGEPRIHLPLLKTKIITVLGRGWVRACKMPQNGSIVLKMAFCWLGIFLVTINLWFFSRASTNLVQTVLFFFFFFLSFCKETKARNFLVWYCVDEYYSLILTEVKRKLWCFNFLQVNQKGSEKPLEQAFATMVSSLASGMIRYLTH